jgi:type IV secretory pathway protease TraF
MSALRRLDIARREATQQINLVGAATVGILGIAQVAATAIAITGVAFGLTQATVDNLTSGLLYDLPPSTIYGLVNRMKLAYASNLTEAAWQNRASSLRTIRGYIELCLPVVIQTNATNAVSVAQPVTVTGNATLATPPAVSAGRASVSEAGASSGPASLTEAAVTAAVNRAIREHNLTTASGPIQKRVPPPPPTPDCRTPVECALAPDTIKQYQTALCVRPDGTIKGLPRSVIHDYLVGRQVIKATDSTDFINDRTKGFFDDLIGLNCANAGFRTTYEVARLGVPKDLSGIKALQEDLRDLVKITRAPAVNGLLDSDTRKAIAEVCPPNKDRSEGTFDSVCDKSIDDQIRQIRISKPGNP